LNADDKKQLRKIFHGRFYNFSARPFDPKDRAPDFPFMFQIQNLLQNSRNGDIRFDIISMLLMMGAESESLKSCLAGALASVNFETPRIVPLWDREKGWSNVYQAFIVGGRPHDSSAVRTAQDLPAIFPSATESNEYTSAFQRNARLLKDGAITQAEHDEARRELLAGLSRPVSLRSTPQPSVSQARSEVSLPPSGRGDAAAAPVMPRDFPPHLFKPDPKDDKPPRREPLSASRFQSIHECEQRYRDLCDAEAKSLETQLSRTRTMIQQLQMKLLNVLGSNFDDPQSTSHIHRELQMLMKLEQTVLQRVDEMREKTRVSLSRQLTDQRKLSAVAVGAGAMPNNREHFLQKTQNLPNMQAHSTVHVARVQVPSFQDQLKEKLKDLIISKPSKELESDAKQSDDKPPRPEARASPTIPSTVEHLPIVTSTIRAKKLYHAFLTHNWGDHPTYTTHQRVKQICNALKGMGLSLWFDEERMAGGNVIQDMTSGIDQSDVVVVFVTKAYCQKVNKSEHDNCKIEFMYAVNRKCSMMIAVPLDGDVLSTPSWDGPVGAILGSNLYPAKFWDRAEINAEHSEFSVEVKKLYDRIVNLCGQERSPSSTVAASAPPSSPLQAAFRSDILIPSKRSHPEFFLAQRIKFCYKVALHACACTSEQTLRLENTRRFSLARMRMKFDTLYNRGIRVRDAFTAIIDSRGSCDVEVLVAPLDELDTFFVRHVAKLAAPPHSAAKFEDMFKVLNKIIGQGKAGRVADLEFVLFFHAFLLATPKFVASDDFLVAYARSVLADSLKEMDNRGWTLSDVFSRLWSGERDMESLFPSAKSDVDQRTVTLFECSAKLFCEKLGLNPALGCSQLLLGDANPFFELLVFVKTLSDIAQSQQSHRELWAEINQLFEAQPSLRIFNEVISLVRRQNEWAANIPGAHADDALKSRYSGRLAQSLTRLTQARVDLKASDPEALDVWDRATQRVPFSSADLTVNKLKELNFKRRISGIVKLVLFLACKPPSAKERAGHGRLVADVLEVLQFVPIDDISGQKRTLASFAPIVKHATSDIIENFVPCADIAASACPDDESALLFARALDAEVWTLLSDAAALEKLELEFKNFLKPVACIAVGRIGVADMMFEVDPVDSHTERLLSRAAELSFRRYSSTTSGRVCAGGPSKEKEKLIKNWSSVPDVRKMLTALWNNPHDFEGAVRGVSSRRAVTLCKRIFSRCQKLAPLDTIEYFLEKNKVPMERIAHLRDRAYYNIGRHRFCEGGAEAERQRVHESLFPQLREADCDIQDAVLALWSGERRRSALMSACHSQLAKDWMSGVLVFVDDLC
jgi:hypothetical protein